MPYIAILTGWFTAEVGRQPWTIYGVLRTADAMTPFLTAPAALVSLLVFCAVYAFIFIFGVFYIYQTPACRTRGAADTAPRWRRAESPDVGHQCPDRFPSTLRGRITMVMFWIAVLVISTLLYVLLDGFDLGIGILFGLARVETSNEPS